MPEQLDFDVLIIGAGPAGMAAAIAAAESGKSVGLVDENPAAGGQIWRASKAKIHPEAQPWVDRLVSSGVNIVPGTSIFDVPRTGIAVGERAGKLVEIRHKSLILCTGARELFLPFPGWTLPRVVGVGGLQALTKSGLEISGKRVLVAGSGPLLMAVAASLAKSGAQLVGLVEQASLSSLFGFGFEIAFQPTKLKQAIQYSRQAKKAYQFGTWVKSVSGDGQAQKVELTNGSKTWEVECDYVACAYGLVPNTELPQLLGCTLDGDFVKVDTYQQTSTESVYCAGEPTCIGGVDLSIVEGQIAGYSATGQKSKAEALFSQRQRHQKFAKKLDEAFALREELKSLATSETVICRCEDVRRNQLSPEMGWRHAKLQTRCGMGPCQGRICGAATRTIFGWKPDSVRLPIYPTTLQHLAELPSANTNHEEH